MKCVKCNRELKYISINNLLVGVHDCNCGSVIVSIPTNRFTKIEDIKCEHCGEYPFDMKPQIDEYTKLSFIKEEQNGK